MNRRKMLFGFGLALANIYCICQAAENAPAAGNDAAEPAHPQTQTLRLVQDDAQDYMVSKIYYLKYVQAERRSIFFMLLGPFCCVCL